MDRELLINQHMEHWRCCWRRLMLSPTNPHLKSLLLLKPRPRCRLWLCPHSPMWLLARPQLGPRGHPCFVRSSHNQWRIHGPTCYHDRDAIPHRRNRGRRGNNPVLSCQLVSRFRRSMNNWVFRTLLFLAAGLLSFRLLQGLTFNDPHPRAFCRVVRFISRLRITHRGLILHIRGLALKQCA